jgi:diaminohydroxyphosphoribosylaminopyrimidine deaminase / 5-amino-6-(5-phosphoribosylamino)uracil reductase
MNPFYMKRCFDLANYGQSAVAPNPLVGCVIVYENEIIGEGYHAKYGKEHAEVVAIRSVKEKSKLLESTLYVNLEPCAHYGKTPPCVDLIIDSKIPRVVISNTDPYKPVNGLGISKLIDAGIQVTTGVFEEEGHYINRRFFKYVIDKRPYIILKWATTSDGFIGAIQNNKKTPVKISNSLADSMVHKWRSEEQAILVGHGTVVSDRPKLTVRHWKGKDPVRIIVEGNPEFDNINKFIPPGSKAFLLSTTRKSAQNKDVTVINIIENSPSEILQAIYDQHISSVLVEGGRNTIQPFIDHNLWDEIRVITAPIELKEGIKSPVITLRCNNEKWLGNNCISYYYNN